MGPYRALATGKAPETGSFVLWIVIGGRTFPNFCLCEVGVVRLDLGSAE